MAGTEEIISSMSKTSFRETSNLIDYITKSKGKRLRPLIFLLSAELSNTKSEHLEEIASSFELIHMASLLHDDVIDESDSRRGKDSVWKKWDPKTAILGGDLLWAKAFKLLLPIISTELTKTILDATTEMIEGELKERMFQGDSNITVEDYLDIISKKTASLYSAAAKSGALLANKTEHANSLEQFGFNFGMAFQIMDDVSDYNGNNEKLGKTVNNDAKQGYFTLPLILALSECDIKDKTAIINALNSDSINVYELAKIIVRKTNALNTAKKMAKEYQTKAIENLSHFYESPQKDELLKLTHSIID